MKVALGFKAHSGWAALIVVGTQDGNFVIVERRRVELVEHEWEKQPYHAAEGMEARAARRLVERGIEAAQKNAVREMRAAMLREKKRQNEVVGSAVLVGNPMPDWTVEQILSVHIRMHKAEGVLFRIALVQATNTCGLRLVAIPEKELIQHAGDLTAELPALGKSLGPPWGKDQKDACLAAMIGLRSRR